MHPLFEFPEYDANGHLVRDFEVSADKSAWFLAGYSYLCFMAMYCLFLHFQCGDFRRSRPLSARRTRRRLICMAHFHYTLLCVTTTVFTLAMTWNLLHDIGYDFAFESWLYCASMAMVVFFTAFNFLTVGKGGFSRIGVHFCIATLLFVVSVASYLWWSEAERVSMAKGLIAIMVVAIPAVSVLFCSMLQSLGVLRLWLEQDVCIRKLCLGGRISAECAAGQVAVRRIVHRERQVEVAGAMNAPLVAVKQDEDVVV